MTPNSHRGRSAKPHELRAEVEVTRHELGDTVEALAAKADVRGRARAKAGQVRDRMRQRTAYAGSRARDTAQLRRRPEGGVSPPDTAGRLPHEPAAREQHEKAAALAQLARDKRVLGATAAAVACGAVLAGRHHCRRHGH
jgi:uncharacterized protein DUF3618